MAVLELTKNNFDQTLDSPQIIVVDFTASWCQPCQTFEHVFSDLSEDSQCKDICFASVDVESDKELADASSVSSVPYIVIVRQQVVLFAQAGILTQEALLDLIMQARAVPSGES